MPSTDARFLKSSLYRVCGEKKNPAIGQRKIYMVTSGFAEFWAAYPLRCKKPLALKAYAKALKGGATQAQILAGVEAYKRHKPGYAEWAHPSSWLNAERWADEHEASVTRPKENWFDECARLHDGACGKRWDHEMLKKHGPLPSQRKASA